MGLRDTLVRQFGKPAGLLGSVAGWIMATRPQGRQRSRWTVELLELGPEDRVLELGCGPGLALRECTRSAGRGLVVGLDHSAVMLAQAARRNRTALARGTLHLVHGGLESLPHAGGPFGRVFAINVLQFLSDRRAAMRALAEVTTAGGTVAITYQPRHRNATRADALRGAQELSACMADAGLEWVRTAELPLRPVPAVCVLGRRSAR
ncbi:MAG TPA: methyltransferase domain-containing protein [Burkholderiales bacterium]